MRPPRSRMAGTTSRDRRIAVKSETSSTKRHTSSCRFMEMRRPLPAALADIVEQDIDRSESRHRTGMEIGKNGCVGTIAHHDHQTVRRKAIPDLRRNRHPHGR